MGYCGFSMVDGALWVGHFGWIIGGALRVGHCGWGIVSGAL